MSINNLYIGKIKYNGYHFNIEDNPTPILKDHYVYLLDGIDVSYQIIQNKIYIHEIISMKDRHSLGFISNKSNDNQYEIRFPLLTHCYKRYINDENMNMGDIYLFNVSRDNIQMVERYGNIQNIQEVRNALLYFFHYSKFKIPKDIQKSNQNYFTKPIQYLSHLNTFNVDPSGCYDIDDCISIDAKHSKIYIHIVDIVSVLSKYNDGSFLTNLYDSMENSYTLYLNGKNKDCFSKDIVRELSFELHQKRNAITIELDIGIDYSVSGYEIYPSIIVNKRTFDYNTFQDYLDKNDKELDIQFSMSFVEKWMKTKIDVPNIYYSIRDNYVTMEKRNSSNSNRFIETFMIITNFIISNHLSNNCNVLFPKRYHPEKLKNIKLEKKVNYNDENDNLINNYVLLKKYKKSYYSLFETGHFGLQLDLYTHFTSPIRRSIDIINHLLIHGYTIKNMDVMIEYINQREYQIYRIENLFHDLCLCYILNQDKEKLYKSYRISDNEFFIPELIQSFYLPFGKSLKDIIYVKPPQNNIYFISELKWIYIE